MGTSGPTKTVWVTRDGERIPVRDMTDSHLLNTIRWLERTHDARVLAMLQPYSAYLSGDPPDGAAMCAEQEACALIEASVEDIVPTYATMIDEARKRGLLGDGD
jgi:hypothetical protein